jgi:PAS domain S-box-containing protein
MNEYRQRNKQLERILNSIADGVFTIDMDSHITFFNAPAERITGVPRKQALGKKCYDVFRANICQSACALSCTMKSGKDRINYHINILNAEGRSVPVSVSTSVLQDENGKIIGGVEIFRDLSTIETLRKEIRDHYSFGDIISKSHEMRRILDILPDIAASGSTVLLEGPSGSGKELIARAIHTLSGVKGKYVAVNCAALPDTLLESELFGYKKGAFSDAKKDKPGRFSLAENGTLFLDEIGDISSAFQVKLLRILQEKEYEPLGATSTIKSNARIITATNKVLSDRVASGSFREDLYYRLNIIKQILPPLSNRREDIPLLIDHFIQKFNATKAKEIETVSEQVLNILMRYDFPGNIRELENIIEFAFVLCHGSVIERQHLPTEMQEVRTKLKKEEITSETASPYLKADKETILKALNQHNGSRLETAAFLGINKSTLWRKMKKYKII